MKALMKNLPQPGLSLVEIEKPRIRNADDVLFKVEYCAICVGETKVYDWTEWAASDSTIRLPTILGHEASGVVMEVGNEVKQFKPGDRITNDVSIHCGYCRQCRSGGTNVCENLEIYGKRRGAFAQYAMLPERVICRLNDKLTLEEGALMENFGVAVHAVELEHHDVGDWAVILGGAGPIGIIASQVLQALGVNTIITDILDWRLDFARKLGGTIVVDARKEDPVQKVMDLTNRKGADFVIEMGANQTVMDQAFDIVRIRGTVVTIGTFDKPISFNPFFKMSRREIRLQGMMGHNWETWRRMNQLIDSGKINLKPLITHILPLEEYRKAFELAKSHEAMKVLLRP